LQVIAQGFDVILNMYFRPVLLLLKVLHVSIRLFAAFAPTAAAGGAVILHGCEGLESVAGHW